MFKRLGIFAVLAVCLFAIAIVMVGCDTDPPIDPPITPPIDPPPVEVTQQRFTGTLPVSDSEVTGLAWNPQGTMLAVGYWGDEPELGVWLYNTATGGYLKNLKGDFGDGVHGVVWGSALFIGTDNWDVQMWDPATGQHLRTITDESPDFVISPDSRILATHSDSDIWLIDIGTGQVLRTITEEEIRDGRTYDWIHTEVAFSPDGSTIASGVWPHVRFGFENVFAHRVHLYDVATGRKKLASPNLGDTVRQVAWNSDGSRIVARVASGVTLLDAATGQLVVPVDDAVGLDASVIEYTYNIAWSPTAPNILAVGGNPGGVIEFLDIAAWQILKTLTLGSDVDFLVFSPDGKTLASGSDNDNLIRLWDVSDVSR